MTIELSFLRRVSRFALGMALMFAMIGGLQALADVSPLPAALEAFVLMAVFAAGIIALLPALFYRLRI